MPISKENMEWLEKKQESQNFCAGMEPPEKDMFLLPPTGESKGTTQVWKLVVSKMWQVIDTSEH